MLQRDQRKRIVGYFHFIIAVWHLKKKKKKKFFFQRQTSHTWQPLIFLTWSEINQPYVNFWVVWVFKAINHIVCLSEVSRTWPFMHFSKYVLLGLNIVNNKSTKQRHGRMGGSFKTATQQIQKTYISQELCNWLALSGLLVKRTRFESPSPIYCNNWIIKNKNKKYIEFSKYLIIISLS